MDIGQFYLGSYGTLEVNSKLLPIFKKHKRPDGTWKSNPKVALTTLDELNESQRCTVNEVIELIVEQNFPRRRISGNLALFSQRDYSRFLIGYNDRLDHITFDENSKGHGVIKFKEKIFNKKTKEYVSNPIQDWGALFKKYPSGVGIKKKNKFNPDNEVSVYDSYLGSVVIDDLVPGHIKKYLESKTRTYGQKVNMLKALNSLWGFASKRNLMGPNPPLDPTRKSHGGIILEKAEESSFKGSKWNEVGLSLKQCEIIEKALFKVRRIYPFMAEACLLLMYTAMRIQECLKIKKSMITKDEDGDPIILMSKYIMKGRAHQKQQDEIYDVTTPVKRVLNSLDRQLKRREFRAYQFVPWLFPTTRISLEKLSNPSKYPGYAESKECRIKTLDDCIDTVKKMTGIEFSLKTLKKANIYFTNKTLGGSHKGKFVSKHKTAKLQEGSYDKPPREEVKKYAREVAKVFTFKKS
jgi:integrase